MTLDSEDRSRAPSRVYVIEDHPIMRKLICEHLENDPALRVSGVAANGEDALHELDGSGVDLVLIDAALPGMSGIDLVRILAKRLPSVPCLIYSGHQEPLYVKLALDAGARGYVLKGDAQDLTAGIRRVLAGEIYVSEPLR